MQGWRVWKQKLGVKKLRFKNVSFENASFGIWSQKAKVCLELKVRTERLWIQIQGLGQENLQAARKVHLGAPLLSSQST